MGAFATLRHWNANLFNAISTAALPKMSTFTSQNLSNTSWAFAKLGHQDNDLFEAIIQAALPDLASFNDHALENMAWVLTRIGLNSSPSAHMLTRRVMQEAKARNLHRLSERSGRSVSLIEDQCADVIQMLLPTVCRNQYLLGFELDLALITP